MPPKRLGMELPWAVMAEVGSSGKLLFPAPQSLKDMHLRWE